MNSPIFLTLTTRLYDWITQKGYQAWGDTGYFYHKDFSKNRDWIKIGVGDNERGLYGVEIFAFRRIHLINDLWQDIAKDIMSFENYIPDTFSLEPKEYINDCLTYTTRMAISADEENIVERLYSFVVEKYDKVLVPELDRISNIKALNSLLNEFNYGVGFPFPFFQRLVVAKLAGNPNYENIFQEMIQAYQKGVKEEPWRADYYMRGLQATKMLYERLRSVEALQNPVLV